MGWSIGHDDKWNRDIGYGVPAICDHPGCGEEIDRGLSYVCGSHPYGGDHGCGLYFCIAHRRTAGASREHAELCSRCYSKREPFVATPDVEAWLRHKLANGSWAEWRKDNPEEVVAIKRQLSETTKGDAK